MVPGTKATNNRQPGKGQLKALDKIRETCEAVETSRLAKKVRENMHSDNRKHLKHYLLQSMLLACLVALAACGRSPVDLEAAKGHNNGAPLSASSAQSGMTLLVVDPPLAADAGRLGAYLSWTIALMRDGKPFDAHSIRIDGGMPSHGHGLPTQPRVTAQTGPGRYRVEGLKFTMPGSWQLVFHIGSQQGNDTIVLEIKVAP